jgi:hypothetical protein
MQIFGTVENFNPEEKLVLDQPINPTYVTKLGAVQCSVDIPQSLLGRENLQGILRAPMLGYGPFQPLYGKVANGKITFSVPYTTQVMGSYVPLEIFLKSGAMDSNAISTYVLIPKASSLSGKATPRATSKATPAPSSKVTSKATAKSTPKPTKSPPVTPTPSPTSTW